jgi:putative GTP pyrophosphokinase
VPPFVPTPEEKTLVAHLVQHYKENLSLIRGFLGGFNSHFIETLGENGTLTDAVHSVKFRMKDPEHLEGKLYRKLKGAKSKGELFEITRENLFLKINDLGGYRILHLHTSQVKKIHDVLLEVIERAQFDLFEKPFANVWDEEAKTFFEGIGIRTEVNPRMYSSVHYVIKARSRLAVTCEIQVRTLADEIWGEIDHRINYPEAHPSLPCREQLRVLARVASSCSRLVDAIMVTHDEWAARPLVSEAKSLDNEAPEQTEFKQPE